MDSRALLDELIAFDTVSRESNLDLIGFVHDYLKKLGVDSELIYSDDGCKANLWATIGPQDCGGVVLSGHTDVVPVDGQSWTVPPFKMTEHNGRLYGRGAADMKGYLACVLSAVPRLVQTKLGLPVHIAFSYDEEVGCLGVRSMIAMLEKRAHKPVACIVGEPTELQPVLGHKGKLGARCHVQGVACHSAYAPLGVNAIEYAAKVITKLRELGDQLAEPDNHDSRFDPPFSTIQVGRIEGGRALNIVPAECRFDWEVRALPDLNADNITTTLKDFLDKELIPEMRAVSRDTGVSFERLQAYPGLATKRESEAAQLVARLVDASDFGTVAFGTEGGLFSQTDIPTVVCGPGSMAQGHKADEHISLEQLEKCDTMMRNLASCLSREQ